MLGEPTEMIFFRKSKQSPDDDPRAEGFKREALVHMQSLFHAARYMTRNAEEAEELVQETYLRAFRFWDRYQEGTNCKAWLFRIQTNTFINRGRRKSPVLGLLDEVDSVESAQDLYEGSGFYDGPEERALKSRFPKKVEEALEALPESFRIPVILADLQDFSYREIAEIMDCPVGTVMSRLYRGRQQLQEALLDHAIAAGIISRESAVDGNGTVSLEAYRDRKRRAANAT